MTPTDAPSEPVPSRPGYSVSSLIVYETCPFQYFSTYVRGFPPPVTPAMTRGTSIHKLISDHLTQPSLLVPEAEPALATMFLRFQESRFNLRPLACESPFTLAFRPADVKGRIDVVLPRPDGGVEVIDFKSGRPKSRADVATGLQLPLYAMAVAERFGLRPQELSYTYYFLQDGTEVSFNAGQEEFVRLQERVEGVMDAIHAGKFSRGSGCRCFACRRVLSRPRRY